MAAQLLSMSEIEGPEENENAFWVAATIPPPKSLVEAFANYPDVVRVPRLLHFLRVAVKQQRRRQQKLHELRRKASGPSEGQTETEAGWEGQRRTAEEHGEGETEKVARHPDELETLIFQGCCLLLEASQRQRNAEAHAEARRLWEEHRVLCFAESVETLDATALSPHRPQEREEEIRKLYSESFVNECSGSMPEMRERLLRSVLQARSTQLEPMRRRTLMEVADFLMTQGEFLEVLQVLEGARRDFDEHPNDFEASSASSSRASVDGPAGTRGSGQLHSVSERPTESIGEPDYREEATFGRLRDENGQEQRAEVRGSKGPLAAFSAVSDVVKGLERLRSGDICAAADALRKVNAGVYGRAFDAAVTQSEVSANGLLFSNVAPKLQEESDKVGMASTDFRCFSEAENQPGSVEAGAGSFSAAASPSFTRTRSIFGVCTPEDVALYAMLCCLAVYNRDELKEQLAEDAPLRNVLEPSPVALRAAILFALSDFEQAFKVVCDMMPAFERDLLLGEECTAQLFREIRRNAVLQFTTAYSSLTLSTLLEAFPQVSAATIREDIVALIERRMLPFRYDGVNDILWRNEPDGIHAVVLEAKRTAADLTHTCQRLCLNVSVEEVFGTALHSACRDDSPFAKRNTVGDRAREGRRSRGKEAGCGTAGPGTTVAQRRTRGRHDSG
ncbi:hypothetical protein TGPRC2_264220 [Toxoplasma gondii TgCatPRC2]|uniref:PCI domain-containing protein n=4 Tax=Toxoplasma gondii TaxID=5811 RepID=A0A151HN64_TOXGO|nr:hypothetical protein TGME49_264220 [Toxoplasma gondii ME49]EPT29814.1 hypothetical protein TGME49_264220 [Toxoplasma gondii ME49]KYF40875.1 hypothetical protein TGARI_264220 [Toxoplasma gondii ARI]KYK70796.1 hypothetical protein TGPRC2_264220 [Toxoplasma gondii TgCatPRC2]PIL96262.1 hypothetical protein TGCOUG_264220 [Toxoplasma gondii COUG]|eukprot:XP_018637194.1 hypothetical protein TGME49_264220 [Toxoplasma gondii ME49]